MQSKVPKTLVYPVSILSLVSIILISVYAFLNAIGGRMNPPQPPFEFEPHISKATVWTSSEGEWLINVKARLSIFDTDKERFSKEGILLKNSSKDVFGEVLLLVVRESLDKEKAKTLLGALGHFNLKKVYVASPYDDTMAALKNLEPRFWYAASPRSWVKWSLFETFGIEKAFTLEGDFLLVDREIAKLISPAIEKEILRRRLPMIKAEENGELSYTRLKYSL